MNSMVNGKVADYFRLLEHIKGKYKLGEEAALVILQEVAADLRGKVQEKKEGCDKDGTDTEAEASETLEKGAPGNEPATEKQLQYLKNLGVQPRKGLSKQEASGLIDLALEEENKKTDEADEYDDEALEVEVMKV